MKVNLNPQIAFRSQTTQPQASKAEVTKPAEPDSFKKSGSVKEDLGKVAKFFTTLSEMTKASVKAVGYGAITLAAGLSCGWLFGALPRGFKKGNSLVKVFKQPLKSVSRKAKVITGVATAIVAGYHLINGKLSANQRTANVDHKLKIGHREG